MKRIVLAACIALIAITPIRSQEVPLTIKGDTQIEKITRLVPVTEEREIVKKLPFEVLAPPDADGYWWTVPAGVLINDRGDVIEVVSAPPGELLVKIKVQTITFDFNFETKPPTVKRQTKFTFGQRVFNIGTIKPPDPPPTPSALQKALQDAYNADLDPAKSAKTPVLADLLAGVVPAAQSSGKIKTAKDLQTLVKSATDLAIGAGAIPSVRSAVGSYLVTVLGTNVSAPADAAFWAKASSEYGYVALTLKGVK